MSIKIPEVKVYKTLSAENIKRTFQPRRIVSAMASDGFLPVIALEAFVEAGRTYQAYKRGGFDEARERITEEFSGAVFWLGGVTGLNWLFEKLGQKLLKLPSKTVDIASDDVRKPLDTFLATQKKTNGAEITRKMMARFKFAKVAASILIANGFIGFVLPRINQAITRSYHKNDNQKSNAPVFAGDNFVQTPSIEEFANSKDKNNKDISFGGMDLLTLANNFENKRNWKLLSVDAGTAGGRVCSARNNDERYEIGFRDISSVYFYMFNMPNMNRWLNKLEQNGIGSRLDPVSAQFTTEYLQNYVGSQKIKVDKFAKDVLGEKHVMPKAVADLFKDSSSVIKLESFVDALSQEGFTKAEINRYKKLALKMSELQPKLIYRYTLEDGKVAKIAESVITRTQVQDVLNGGHINNPEFLKAFYQNILGDKFMDKYKYIAQSDLDSMKSDLVNYVKSVIEGAKKSGVEEITSEMLAKASRHNLKMNAINWGTGFVISAAFLSTFIPKLQYLITKIRTGQDAFPGTEQYRQQENKNQPKQAA
jgi:hypothetical protein